MASKKQGGFNNTSEQDRARCARIAKAFPIILLVYLAIYGVVCVIAIAIDKNATFSNALALAGVGALGGVLIIGIWAFIREKAKPCPFGKHEYEGCTCTRCGNVRNEQHDWDVCTCKRCGKAAHNWQLKNSYEENHVISDPYGSDSSGVESYGTHSVYELECSRCGQRRKELNCSVAGEERSA